MREIYCEIQEAPGGGNSEGPGPVIEVRAYRAYPSACQEPVADAGLIVLRTGEGPLRNPYFGDATTTWTVVYPCREDAQLIREAIRLFDETRHPADVE